MNSTARKRPWVAWLTGLLLLCTSCASAPAAPPRSALDRITETGEIRIGTSGEQPPLTMTARNGELLGLDIALARVLAQSMGVEARFVQLPFGQLLDALLAGQLDLVMSGMTITPQTIMDRGGTMITAEHRASRRFRLCWRWGSWPSSECSAVTSGWPSPLIT